MTTPFVDRSAQLFGREGDLDALMHRAEAPALTVVIGRALTRKTWTMLGLGRPRSRVSTLRSGPFSCILWTLETGAMDRVKPQWAPTG
jgi:hypothetical protein